MSGTLGFVGVVTRFQVGLSITTDDNTRPCSVLGSSPNQAQRLRVLGPELPILVDYVLLTFLPVLGVGWAGDMRVYGRLALIAFDDLFPCQYPTRSRLSKQEKSPGNKNTYNKPILRLIHQNLIPQTLRVPSSLVLYRFDIGQDGGEGARLVVDRCEHVDVPYEVGAGG